MTMVFEPKARRAAADSVASTRSPNWLGRARAMWRMKLAARFAVLTLSGVALIGAAALTVVGALGRFFVVSS
jgi:hypothetical protein